MLPFRLSQTDADSVNIERKTHSEPLIRDRMSVLRLLHLGYKRVECAHIVGCCANSVTNYTTEGFITVDGTVENETLSVILPYYPSGVDRLNVFLILNGESSGKVFCRDLVVEVMK